MSKETTIVSESESSSSLTYFLNIKKTMTSNNPATTRETPNNIAKTASSIPGTKSTISPTITKRNDIKRKTNHFLLPHLLSRKLS